MAEATHPMLKSIQNHFRKPTTQAAHPDGQKVSASHAKFLPVSNPLYVKRDATPPTGKETHRWLMKYAAKPAAKPTPEQWLAKKIKTEGPGPERDARFRLAMGYCRAALNKPTPLHSLDEANAQAVEGAVNDYVTQCGSSTSIKRTGPVANLLSYIRTGNDGAFDGTKRNCLGQQRFRNRFEAVDFLVNHTSLIKRLEQAGHGQEAGRIKDLHAEMARTERQARQRGAGL